MPRRLPNLQELSAMETADLLQTLGYLSGRPVVASNDRLALAIHAELDERERNHPPAWRSPTWDWSPVWRERLP